MHCIKQAENSWLVNFLIYFCLPVEAEEIKSWCRRLSKSILENIIILIPDFTDKICLLLKMNISWCVIFHNDKMTTKMIYSSISTYSATWHEIEPSPISWFSLCKIGSRILSYNLIILCSFRKNPYPPHGRSLEISIGRGVLKVKILEAKYEAKLEFPGGTGGTKQKTFRGRSMDIFWNCTLIMKL